MEKLFEKMIGYVKFFDFDAEIKQLSVMIIFIFQTKGKSGIPYRHQN